MRFARHMSFGLAALVLGGVAVDASAAVIAYTGTLATAGATRTASSA